MRESTGMRFEEEESGERKVEWGVSECLGRWPWEDSILDLCFPASLFFFPALWTIQVRLWLCSVELWCDAFVFSFSTHYWLYMVHPTWSHSHLVASWARWCACITFTAGQNTFGFRFSALLGFVYLFWVKKKKQKTTDNFISRAQDIKELCRYSL